MRKHSQCSIVNILATVSASQITSDLPGLQKEKGLRLRSKAFLIHNSTEIWTLNDLEAVMCSELELLFCCIFFMWHYI